MFVSVVIHRATQVAMALVRNRQVTAFQRMTPVFPVTCHARYGILHKKYDCKNRYSNLILFLIRTYPNHNP